MLVSLVIQVLITAETVTANLECLQCTEAVSPTDCDTVTLCGSHERCYTDTFVTAVGSIRYNQGCRDAQQCGPSLVAVGKREFSYNHSNVEHTSNSNHTKDRIHGMGHTVPDASAELNSSFYRRSSGTLICSECCKGSLCNSAGCGSKGYISPRGPVCYNCPQQLNTNDCSKITLCGEDEVCILHKTLNPVTHEIRYESKCEGERKCEEEVQRLKQISQLVGRRKRTLQIESCIIHCCKTDLCNTNCSFTSPSTSTMPPAVTSARVSSAPTTALPASLDPCLSNPCMQGTCSMYQDTYSCTCRVGFWGRNCDQASITKVPTPSTQAVTSMQTPTKAIPSTTRTSTQSSDPCLSNPCVGGTCSVYLSTYRCSCTIGFSGRNCEKGGPVTQQTTMSTAPITTQLVDPCLSNPCDRGSCTSYQNTFTCQCEFGFSGPTCNKEISPVWPCGTYGLMRTAQGCPDNSHFTVGWRKQSTEDTLSNRRGNNFSASIENYMAGIFTDTIITTGFCMKTDVHNATCLNQKWPKGAYCILRYSECPEGFASGYVYWDDEDIDNNNRFNGTMPDGVYSVNTKIFYCCRNDGNQGTAVLLPYSRPFILIRYGNRCQSVHKMTVRDLFVAWDDEDLSNNSVNGGMYPYDDGGSNDHVLHFCYYSSTI